MRSIGIRELKEDTSRILRRVRERGQEIEITYRGRVVALIVPATPKPVRPRDAGRVWSGLDRLAREIGARWPKGVSAADAVRAVRR